MDTQTMINAVIAFIQQDQNLLAVIRFSATKNIQTLQDDQLNLLITTLNIPVNP